MSIMESDQEPGPGPTYILILTENKPPLELTVTPELLELLNLSTLIGRYSSDRFSLSFSTIIIGLCFDSHSISRWFQLYLEDQKVDINSILSRLRLDRKLMGQIMSEAGPVVRGADGAFANEGFASTVSAYAWLEHARRLASEQGQNWTGLRHVMAALIFDPDLHTDELKQWGLDREALGRSYLGYIATDLPDDFDFCKNLFDETFHPAPTAPQLPLSRPARQILERANKARSDDKKDRIYTEHLVRGLYESGVQLAHLARSLNANLEQILRRTYGESSSAPLNYLEFPVSENALEALQKANQQAAEQKSSTLDERHLLFGVLSQTSSQVVRELNALGLTSDKVAFPPPTGDGPASAHVATDSWTVHDALGHKEYARAIYSFIIDDQTEAPLAISIQAPWGGGKTSLMRMVQQQLDPGATEKLEAERKKRRDRTKIIEEEVKPAALKAEIGKDAMTILDVLKEIAVWKSSRASNETVKNPSVPSDAAESQSKKLGAPERHRITVWFNAWKYQNTEQVWAGLADSILRQVTNRMEVPDRQRFWLQLQLARLDSDKIRQDILDRIATEWWRVARPWLWGTLAAILAGVESILIIPVHYEWTGFLVSVLGSLAGGVKLLQLYAKKKSEVEKEPAELSLGRYLQVPDYRSKVGFIHEVAEDLNRVMNAIPRKYLPIVVFIDDLDRCSPQKVAEVTEGINLFLAGEFPDCMFVFGMDAEIVAAALEMAHRDVIKKLPAYASGIPVGWRFMDKFVQLPFVIPPPEREDLIKYIESLLKRAGEQAPVPDPVQKGMADLNRKSAPEEVLESVASMKDELKKHNLSDAQKRNVESQLNQAERLARIDLEIARASQDDKAVREFILQVAPDLYNNPRDLKRFLNTFRLHDFLRIAREGRNISAPSRPLIAQWIRLSLRWPQMVRWLHRVAGEVNHKPSFAEGTSKAHDQLEQIETIAGEVPESEGAQGWKRRIVERLGSTVADLEWTSDPTLFEFFKEMSAQPEDERLSFGAGNGLW